MPVSINIKYVAVYIFLSICLAVISYFILKRKRNNPFNESLIILVAMIYPPLPVVILLYYSCKPIKVPPS